MSAPTRRTAVYSRVSTSGQTTASQDDDLMRWLGREGDGLAVWHRDTFTGRTLDRPGWSALWAGVLAGKYARIVVWRLDRLGRTPAEVVPLFGELVRHGVALVSLREGFDLRTPAGKLLAGMLASFAGFELEVRAERQHAGIAAAKKRGVKFGRPKVADGKAKRIKVTDEQAELARRLKAEGVSVAAIARATGLSRPTVYGLLADGEGEPASR